MDFSDALKAAKAGQRITRTGWNGNKLGSGMRLMWVQLMNEHVFPDARHGEHRYPRAFFMKTADETFVPWTISHTDALAEDWQIV